MELHIRLEGRKGLADQLYLLQWALAGFLGEGHLNKHIRRCHEVYSACRERILARLGGDPSLWFSKVEVGLYSLAPLFSKAPVRPGLLLGFGAIELLDIDPALDRVRDTLQRLS